VAVAAGRTQAFPRAGRIAADQADRIAADQADRIAADRAGPGAVLPVDVVHHAANQGVGADAALPRLADPEAEFPVADRPAAARPIDRAAGMAHARCA
jgi:hypothetical protein